MAEKEQRTEYKTIQKEHPTVTYYKREDISLVISKGLATTVREEPRNPIEYFATWLLEYNKVQKQAKQRENDEKEVVKLKERQAQVDKALAVEQAEAQKVADAKTASNNKFWEDLGKSEDPFDNLEALTEYIHANVASTGVYIGQLEPPFKQIADDAEENAHLDKSSPEIIKFKFANADHKNLIVGTTLKPGSGISHDVFKDETTQINDLISCDYDDDAILDQFSHIYVPEVVREKRMNYWKVPRLGSFMAIPLVYKSCLSVESFEHAVRDWTRYRDDTKKQDEEKETWRVDQEQKRADASAAGTPYEEEVKEWPVIELPPIRTELKKFVVCIDSMGQDREFSDAQKKFALSAVYRFRKHWEEFELEKLKADRDAQVKDREADVEKFTAEFIEALREKEEALVEAKINPPPPAEGTEKKEKEGEEEVEVDPEVLANEVTELRLKFQLDQLQTDPEYKARYEGLVGRKVVRHQTFFKCIYYLLEDTKENICEENTQNLFWKIARHRWNADLIAKMSKYQFLGPKSQAMKSYQSINYIEKCIADRELTEEKMASYNQSLGLIFKWMNLALTARKKDIVQRLYAAKQKKQDREAKIAEDKQRSEDRAAALAEAIEKHDAEHADQIAAAQEYEEAVAAGNPPELEEGEEKPTRPVFDDKFFLYNWDEEHPAITIPPEVIDDIDNDWVLTEEMKEELIAAHAQALAEAAVPPDPKAGKR